MIWILAWTVAVGASAAAPTVAQTPVVSQQEEARSAFMQFFQAYSEGDGQGMVRLMTGDILLSYPGRNDVGRAQIEQLIASQAKAPAAPRPAYSVDIEEGLVSGDLAVFRILWTVTSKNRETGTETVSREKDVEVWKRELDGQWRFARGISFPLKRPAP